MTSKLAPTGPSKAPPTGPRRTVSRSNGPSLTPAGPRGAAIDSAKGEEDTSLLGSESLPAADSVVAVSLLPLHHAFV